MVNFIRSLCLSYPGVEEEPHFEKTSFRIRKKIFATLDREGNKLCVRLSAENQALFGLFDPTVVYPVPNQWGTQGWTFVDTRRMPDEALRDIISSAFHQVSSRPKRSK